MIMPAVPYDCARKDVGSHILRCSSFCRGPCVLKANSMWNHSGHPLNTFTQRYIFVTAYAYSVNCLVGNCVFYPTVFHWHQATRLKINVSATLPLCATLTGVQWLTWWRRNRVRHPTSSVNLLVTIRIGGNQGIFHKKNVIATWVVAGLTKTSQQCTATVGGVHVVHRIRTLHRSMWEHLILKTFSLFENRRIGVMSSH